MNKVLLAAVAATLASSANAYTPQGEWYTRVGLGITIPDAKATERFLADEIAADTGNEEDVKFDYPRGYSFNLGYRLNRFIAFEAGYTSMGEEKRSYSYYNFYGDLETQGYEVTESWTYKGQISGNVKTLAAAFSTDAYRTLSGGVRLGYAFWNTKADVTVTYENQRLELNSDDEVERFSIIRRDEPLADDKDGSDPFYGVFVNWRLDKWTYSLEHNLYITGETDQSVSSISLSMDF